MNGIHDMGGMHGFGRVERDEAQFHADWERVVFAIDRIIRAREIHNTDEKRHAIEQMDPAAYLRASYFERWLTGSEKLLIEKDVISEAELEEVYRDIVTTDSYQAFVPERDDEEIAAQVREAWERPAAHDRPDDESAFDVGTTVRVRNIHPEGHTRCPRYVRNLTGEISQVQGSYMYPDSNAHGGERTEPLYTVAFTAGELWGSNAESPDDIVHVDLWEPYLKTPTNNNDR